MPVKWIMHWQHNSGATLSSQILMEASQCAESINGVKEGRWKSTLTFYRPVLRDQSLPTEYAKDFLGLSLQEKPNKYYFIIRTSQLVVEADSSILTIMEKLQSYKNRVSLNFEGLQYRIGDFQLRVGKIVSSNSESLRGIMMEVEYLPISSIMTSRRVMEDFFNMWKELVSMKSLPGHFMHIEPNFSEYGLQDTYSSQHTAVQYATIMAQLIATGRN
ncbi:Mediator of RNA polymerase II transcription subunit 20a [Zostera marina]|uniref:Mediator of RNA polymerase II transcription subunit 20 n=1 Tax=Zostera marina TaxID=29655 RepID=A0A0K9PMP7_ZOSMR|nr:Mediator of RNA polymerase II transcription subunit 20a [Zostera marina]